MLRKPVLAKLRQTFAFTPLHCVADELCNRILVVGSAIIRERSVYFWNCVLSLLTMQPSCL